MEDKRFEELLFGLIRNGMGQPSPLPTITWEDVKKLEEFGARQNIIPILWEGLKAQELPAEWTRTMDRMRLKSIYCSFVREDFLQQISQAFQKASISFVPLKGAVLQALYPEPWMRTSSDLDILVHEEDLARAVACLEDSTDLRFDKRNYHDVTMLNEQICLELHFCILENLPKLDPLLSRVWEYARPDGDTCRYELTPEFMLFHTLAHMNYHMRQGGLGIRPFLDLWLLREKTEYDEEQLRQMCRDCGLLRFYETACEMVSAWMEGGEHTETTRLLQALCLSGSVFGSAHNGARQRDHQGASYVLRRLFASRNVLEEMYPRLRSAPFLLPLYQVKRWLRLLDPVGRKEAMWELKTQRSISKESIRSFDALMNRLGL